MLPGSRGAGGRQEGMGVRSWSPENRLSPETKNGSPWGDRISNKTPVHLRSDGGAKAQSHAAENRGEHTNAKPGDSADVVVHVHRGDAIMGKWRGGGVDSARPGAVRSEGRWVLVDRFGNIVPGILFVSAVRSTEAGAVSPALPSVVGGGGGVAECHGPSCAVQWIRVNAGSLRTMPHGIVGS